MFEQVDFNKDVDSIIAGLDRNRDTASRVRRQIKELKQHPETIELSKSEETIDLKAEEREESEEETDEELSLYIDEYRKISGDDEESIIALLPDPDDYEYKNIIYRLHAESLKEIKEMTEIMLEDGDSKDESKSFIENEKKKINILRKLLLTEEIKEEEQEELNTIILAPLESGRIRILDDIDSIPRDYYGKLHDLIQSIVNGSFKRAKRFSFGENRNQANICEVRGQGIRVTYQRLNKNTYALTSAFLKKTDNDHGYRDYMITVYTEYKKVEEALKNGLSNPEFMALHEDYVQEMWNKLGIGETSKKYGKGGLV